MSKQILKLKYLSVKLAHLTWNFDFRMQLFQNHCKETWYYMPEGRIVRQDNSTTESLKASSKTEDSELFNAMVADDGPLAAGSLPAVRAASEAGCKKLFQSLDKASQLSKEQRRRLRKRAKVSQ